MYPRESEITSLISIKERKDAASPPFPLPLPSNPPRTPQRPLDDEATSRETLLSSFALLYSVLFLLRQRTLSSVSISPRILLSYDEPATRHIPGVPFRNLNGRIAARMFERWQKSLAFLFGSRNDFRADESSSKFGSGNFERNIIQYSPHYAGGIRRQYVCLPSYMFRVPFPL